MNLKVFTDGGARGNPGPAACAYLIYDPVNLREKSGKYLGVTTNNVAEYQGVIEGLKSIRENIKEEVQKIEFFLDSQLVVMQLNGLWKIKDQNLKRLVTEIKELENDLNIFYNYIPREKNKDADLLVNLTLDNHGSA